MITEQERRRRKVTLRFIQLSLVLLTVGILGAFFTVRRSVPRGPNVEISSGAPKVSTELGPGDMQIVNVDNTVDLILRGAHIFAGLSPAKVAEVRAEMEKGTANQTGVGAAIASAVKEQVADKMIGWHLQYEVAEIEDIRAENDRIVIDWRSGKQQELFGSIKIDGEKTNRFDPEEAQRFVEAVKARQAQLRSGWRDPRDPGASHTVIVKPLRP